MSMPYASTGRSRKDPGVCLGAEPSETTAPWGVSATGREHAGHCGSGTSG